MWGRLGGKNVITEVFNCRLQFTGRQQNPAISSLLKCVCDSCIYVNTDNKKYTVFHYLRHPVLLNLTVPVPSLWYKVQIGSSSKCLIIQGLHLSCWGQLTAVAADCSCSGSRDGWTPYCTWAVEGSCLLSQQIVLALGVGPAGLPIVPELLRAAACCRSRLFLLWE